MGNRSGVSRQRKSGDRRGLFVGLSAAVLWAGLAPTAVAQETNFYAGKTVDFYIGYDAGASYDIYARLMAENIGRFIPGHPSIISRNMPGAASMRVMSYLHEAAKKTAPPGARSIATSRSSLCSMAAIRKRPSRARWSSIGSAV